MPATDNSRALDHVVVVLFENRSLDNVLGHLYGPEDGKTFEGVIGKDLSNPIPDWAEDGADRGVAPYTIATDMDSPNPDSGEEYPHTNTQLYNIVNDANRFKVEDGAEVHVLRLHFVIDGEEVLWPPDHFAVDAELRHAIRELQEDESSSGHVLGGAYQVLDLSDNELAKVHTRYLAGGRARGNVRDELLYRFEFPDRPRALATFLEALQSTWNISLFHYRNHGADVGRVLVGFQVVAKDHERFRGFLNQLAYVFHEETDNQMYQELLL